MASTRLTVSGLLPKELYDGLVSLLSSYSDRACAFESRETLFRSTATSSADSTTTTAGEGAGGPRGEDVRLVYTSLARQEEEFALETLSRPEPARLTPDYVAQVVVTVPLTLVATTAGTIAATDRTKRERAVKFVRALGLHEGVTIRKRGLLFKRGPVDIHVAQLLETDTDTVLTPDHYLVTVTSQFALPKESASGASAGSNRTASSTNAGASQAPSSATPGPGQPAADASAQSNRAWSEAKMAQTRQLLRGYVKLERGDV